MLVAAAAEPSASRVPPVHTGERFCSSRESRTSVHRSGSIFTLVPIGQNLHSLCAMGLPSGIPALRNAASMSATLSSATNRDS